MSEIEMKIKTETECYDDICKKLADRLTSHLDAGLDEADTEEVGCVIDMIKDLCEAKEKKTKAMYYAQILKAMEESDYGDDYDEDGPKYYRGRSKTTGRYMHRPYTKMMERDMDRDEGKMYYTEYTGNMPATLPSSQMTAKGYDDGYIDGFRSSRYERTRKGYEESKKLSGSEEDTEEKVKSLDAYLGTIETDLKALVPGMSNHEKTIMKNRLQSIQNIVV